MHDNSDIVDNTINFYNDNVDPKILHAVNQEKSYIRDGEIVQKEATIVLRGNAEKNFQKLYDEGYRNFALHERNDFALIDDSSIYENYISIKKAFSISANGKVYAGCLEPYDKLDNGIDVICDIFECNSDLFSRIIDYCWASPLTEEQARKLENWYTILWYYEHGFTDCWLSKVPLNDDMIRVAKISVELMEEFKQGLCKFHKLFPQMTLFELNLMGAIKFGYEIKDMELRKIVLTDICGLKIGNGNDCMLPDFSDKTLGDFLDGYEKNIYYKRQLNLDGNISFSDALVEKAIKDAVAKIATPANIIAGLLLVGMGAAAFSKVAEKSETEID